MQNKIKYLIPSIADVFFFLLLMTLFFLVPGKLLLDCDTAYHIRIGEFILNTFSIPRYDLFSFLDPPPRWIAFEWLSQAIMGFVYSWGALAGLISFSSIPLKVWTYLGLLVSMSSLFYMMFIIIRTFVHGIDVPGYASLMVVLLFFSGLNMIGMGILGEYVSRVFIEVKQRPLYLVREKIGFTRK